MVQNNKLRVKMIWNFYNKKEMNKDNKKIKLNMHNLMSKMMMKGMDKSNKMSK